MDWASHMRTIIATLGDDWMFTHGAGSPVQVRGLYMAPYRAAQLGTPGVTGIDPHMAVMAVDIGSVAMNDTFVRISTGETYKVKTFQPDSESGILVLPLKKP